MADGWISLNVIVNCYVALVQFAMPIAVFFGVGNLLFDMFCSAAFGGILKIGGRV